MGEIMTFVQNLIHTHFNPEIYDPSDIKLAQYRTSILDDGGIDTYDFSLIDVDTEFSYVDPPMVLSVQYISRSNYQLKPRNMEHNCNGRRILS